MPLAYPYQSAKIRKTIPRPAAPWSISFRRWARPFCPFVDRFTSVLDSLERQRQTLHFVHAFIDLARFPTIKATSLLTDIVLPLYIRWLQQHLSPPGAQRPAVIVAPTVRHAGAIARSVWQKTSHTFSVNRASHSPFSFNRLRGLTFHYALLIHTDRLRTRHRTDRYSLLYRTIAPAIFRGNDSALIIVGDSREHPRLSFARQAAAPPYPLKAASEGHIIILTVPDLCPIPPPPESVPIMPLIYSIPMASEIIL